MIRGRSGFAVGLTALGCTGGVGRAWVFLGFTNGVATPCDQGHVYGAPVGLPQLAIWEPVWFAVWLTTPCDEGYVSCECGEHFGCLQRNGKNKCGRLQLVGSELYSLGEARMEICMYTCGTHEALVPRAGPCTVFGKPASKTMGYIQFRLPTATVHSVEREAWNSSSATTTCRADETI
eukprot:1261160-Pyramimonas_sp.AAC.2